MSGDLHFAECHSSSKVLLIKGTQASGVEMLFEDSVLLAEVHGVDLVAVHEIDQGQLGGQMLHTGREYKDRVGWPGK